MVAYLRRLRFADELPVAVDYRWMPADVVEGIGEQDFLREAIWRVLRRYKNVDMAKNPNAYCLPPGPSRALTGPSPFMIVQHKDVVSFNFENHGVYRIIYLDGRGHPAEIADYLQFMGHSTGKWEGDTLVVDTVGINDRTWLDSYGLEHSDKLHLTERFQKTGPDTIKYTVTYDDPVFFTKPWTASLNFARQKDRLMEYVCTDNEKDRANLVPTPREP